MTTEVLLIVIAVLVLLGVGLVLWGIWKQAVYEGSIKAIAVDIQSVGHKIDITHTATNSRMDQLLKATMDLADAAGYKRAQDEQAAKDSLKGLGNK